MGIKKSGLLLCAACVIALASVAGFAQSPQSPPSATTATSQPLPDRLNSAFLEYQTARLHAELNHDLAVQKQRNDDRVRAVGMGYREASQMMQLHAVEGVPYSSADTEATASAWKKSQADAKAAYLAYVASATPDQKVSAKKLYVAWLSYMTAFQQFDGNPLDFSNENTVASNAYNTAVNEFKVDSL